MILWHMVICSARADNDGAKECMQNRHAQVTRNMEKHQMIFKTKTNLIQILPVFEPGYKQYYQCLPYLKYFLRCL